MNLDTIQLTIVQRSINSQISSFKSPTNQAALYLLQITQLVQHFHSNSMQIIPINIHHLIIALSINQLTIQQTSLQSTVNYQNITFKSPKIQAALYLL